jgi:hypothetical protein
MNAAVEIPRIGDGSRSPPLVPVECNMGGNEWFPLHFRRLRKSKWWRRASDLARSRNVMLWGEAYQSTPAGSLADDDDELAEAAGFGMDVEAFLAAKAEIMAPWMLCTDGRWYHPTLCEVVIEAWEKASEKRQKEARRKAEQRAKVRTPVRAEKANVPRDTANGPTGQPEPSRGTGGGVTRDQCAQEEEITGEEKTGQDSRSRDTVAASKPRGARLPADWSPTEADRAYAAAQGFSPALTERVAERFRNYWLAKTGRNATKLDWPATWRNWVLEEADRRGVKAGKTDRVDWI